MNGVSSCRWGGPNRAVRSSPPGREGRSGVARQPILSCVVDVRICVREAPDPCWRNPSRIGRADSLRKACQQPAADILLESIIVKGAIDREIQRLKAATSQYVGTAGLERIALVPVPAIASTPNDRLEWGLTSRPRWPMDIEKIEMRQGELDPGFTHTASTHPVNRLLRHRGVNLGR